MIGEALPVAAASLREGGAGTSWSSPSLPSKDPRPFAPADPRRGVEIGPPVWSIETLVGQGREALILHEGDTYRLRIPSKHRLILTK